MESTEDCGHCFLPTSIPILVLDADDFGIHFLAIAVCGGVAFHFNTNIVGEHGESTNGGDDRMEQEHTAKAYGANGEGRFEQDFAFLVLEGHLADVPFVEDSLYIVKDVFTVGADFFKKCSGHDRRGKDETAKSGVRIFCLMTQFTKKNLTGFNTYAISRLLRIHLWRGREHH